MCINCKHHVRASTEQVRRTEDMFYYWETVDIPKHCAQKNDEVFNSWWIENGHKTLSEIQGDSPPVCFEATAADIAIDKMLDMMDNITEYLKNRS